MGDRLGIPRVVSFFFFCQRPRGDSTESQYNSCGPICLNKACSNLTLCDFLSDERSLLIPPYLTIFPTPPPLPPTPPHTTYSTTREEASAADRADSVSIQAEFLCSNLILANINLTRPQTDKFSHFSAAQCHTNLLHWNEQPVRSSKMSHKTTVGIRGTEKLDGLTSGWRPLDSDSLGTRWQISLVGGSCVLLMTLTLRIKFIVVHSAFQIQKRTSPNACWKRKLGMYRLVPHKTKGRNDRLPLRSIYVKPLMMSDCWPMRIIQWRWIQAEGGK